MINKKTTSKSGIELIKIFEGLRTKAYKPVPSEKYWTIGYGHYGPDVNSDDVWTVEKCEEMLKSDLKKYEKAVNELPYVFTQNEFDALVSFTYNCGTGNLVNLTNNGKRDKKTIAEKIVLYNKAGGKVLAGLTRRRNEEQAMFLGQR